MKNIIHISTATALLLAMGWVSTALAQATGSAKLVSPVEGAVLDPTQPIQVVYEVTPGPKVDHIHLYVDGKETAVLRENRGSHAMPALSQGPHEICVKAVTRAHVPTGIEQCNKVTVQ